MKFIKIIRENFGWTSFQMSEHNSHMVNCGNQIWSNGSTVEVAEYCDSEGLQELIDQVENKQAFRGALLRMGFDL